jgi:hypothetical protein
MEAEKSDGGKTLAWNATGDFFGELVGSNSMVRWVWRSYRWLKRLEKELVVLGLGISIGNLNRAPEMLNVCFDMISR